MATFNGAISAGSIYGGAGADTLAFTSATIASGATIDQGAGSDSVFFGTATDLTATTLTGNGADTFTLLGENTVVFGALATAASRVSLGSNADQVTFNGAIAAGSIYGGQGADTLHFVSGSSLTNTSIQGGGGAELFSGAVSLGTGHVSFWGGAGADTFNFTSITGAPGKTAWFWNDAAGTDSIVFGQMVSGGTGNNPVQIGPGVGFGLATGAGMNISFLNSQTTQSFGAALKGGISNAFEVHNNAVSFGIDTNNYVTLLFHGGGIVQLQGFDAAEAVAITNTFGVVNNTGTTNFGVTKTIQSFS